MTARLLDAPHRPAAVTTAAVLAVLAGGMTLIASVVVIGALGTLDVSLPWLVAVTQVTGAVLLVVGGLRLAQGAGRAVLLTGATLQLGHVSRILDRGIRAQLPPGRVVGRPEYNPVCAAFRRLARSHLDHEPHRPRSTRHALICAVWLRYAVEVRDDPAESASVAALIAAVAVAFAALVVTALVLARTRSATEYLSLHP
ncbi:MAG: hypothetical protein GEV28_28970 [Actinophytocola sp.]|uniref:hypothetical protein n=1 Tax=Actinophytocola sp. TaxID=1872138 RepID=UPI0013273BD9|nr:hypothetical protein [Actinophytocola sp.]MPZ84216.1 hypothetical protein [Actinophytocola sp.]